jgi:hypothetical protein
MMELKPWMPAVEAQMFAYQLARRLMVRDTHSEMSSSWNVDAALLHRATPYMWSKETTRAVLQASKSIPAETQLNKWNMTEEVMWWWFEEPLPFRTTPDSGSVRALAFGWIPMKEEHGVPIPRFGMPVVSWTDDPTKEFHICPSQTFEWEADATLENVLIQSRRHHEILYNPHFGRWKKLDYGLIGADAYCAAVDGLARFMLAGLAWMKQKVAIVSGGNVERHRRKEFKKRFNRDLDSVRVISLRKAERPEHEKREGESQREYHFRWVVTGHWRNQSCGPNHADHRLTYILPYMKGPDDAPLKESKRKVYTIDR